MADGLGISGAPTARYAALDSLRGICACMVVLCHWVTTGIITNLQIVRGGYFFVDFFFVLSGFVITASYGQRLAEGFSVARFMFLRLGRIYPLHLAVLSLFLILEMIGMANPGLANRPPFTGSRSAMGLLDNLLLLQTFNPSEGLTWNNPAWTIAAEFWTYLLAAIIFSVATKYLQACTMILVLLSGAWLWSTPTYIGHSADWGIIRCFYGFGCGMIAFQLSRRLGGVLLHARMPVATGMEVIVAGLALWLVSFCATAAHLALSMLAPPVFLMAIVIFAAERGRLSGVLLTRPLRLLGLWSYSIYMVHEFLQGRLLDMLKLAGGQFGFSWVITRPDGVKDLIALPLICDGLTIIMLVVVIFAAWISYNVIERPARSWSRMAAARIWGRHGSLRGKAVADM